MYHVEGQVFMFSLFVIMCFPCRFPTIRAVTRLEGLLLADVRAVGEFLDWTSETLKRSNGKRW